MMNESELLSAGFHKFGMAENSIIKNRILEYINRIIAYNRKVNITGTESAQDIIIRHVFDSLSILRPLSKIPGTSVADVGSGAGFPGMVLGIADPVRKYTLIESKKKKGSFLLEVIAALSLDNVACRTANVFEISEKFDIILCRALGSVKKILKLSRNIRTNSTAYILSKGTRKVIEAELMESDIHFTITPVCVPFLNEERNLLVHIP